MQIDPESDFSTTYPEWNARYKEINATLKHAHKKQNTNTTISKN